MAPGAALMVVIGLSALPARAAQEAVKVYDIARGPAVKAVDQFARQAELNILASRDTLERIETNQVRGTFSATEALARLLAGTGLAGQITSSGSVFITASAAPPVDIAQGQNASTSPPPPAGPGPAAAPVFMADPSQPVAEIRIVGTRLSQQSSIVQKKHARTAVEAIVAEDIGAFPDKNVGEALSRLVGLSLDRGDYGEGISVGLRGVGPDMTRVEIDGMGMNSAAGAGLLGADDRANEFRELPSDLIKTAQVSKGATAADTEGGLAGMIRIETRTGLDFSRRFMSARVSANKNTINQRWAPDWTLVYADRLLDGRLGVVANLTRSRAYNEHHAQETGNNGNSGPTQVWDFDQSPEKTFTYNPATLSSTDPAVDQPLDASPFALTPRQIVTRSAAARTKDECYAAIPLLTAAQTSFLSSRDQGLAMDARGRALISCLNQWSDFSPTNIRFFMKRQDDTRTSGDLRLDFKLAPGLSVFGKVMRQRRLVHDTFLTHTLGNIGGGGTTTSPAYSGPTFYDDPASGMRIPVPASGYHSLPGLSWRNGDAPVSGMLTNVDPATVEVDRAHHLVRATIADGSIGTNEQFDRIEVRNGSVQAGLAFRRQAFKLDLHLARVRSDFTRENRRIGLGYGYGPVTIELTPQGLWTYRFAGSAPDQADVAQYTQLAPQPAQAAVPASINNPAIPAYSSAQLPLVGQGVRVEFTPYGGQVRESMLKLDMAYAPATLPLLTSLKFGLNRRTYSNQTWGPVGYQRSPAIGTYGQPDYVPPVVVPTSRFRSSWIVPCLDTPGSLGPGGRPCQYGYNPHSQLFDRLQGNVVLSPQQYQDLWRRVFQKQAVNFFDSGRNVPSGLVSGWDELDVMKAIELSGLRNYSPDCIRSCTANDGKVYSQPTSIATEQVTAGYLMAEYSVARLPYLDWQLPFGLELEGNWGARYVRTRVRGTGLMTLNSTTKTASFDPARPDRPEGLYSTSLTRLTSISSAYTNILPSFNTTTWLMPDRLALRYNWAKMMARPRVSQVAPSGTCSYHELRAERGEAMECTGRLGNPALRPALSTNQNFAVEYYPNKDTALALAHFRHRSRVGLPRQVTYNDHQVFANSDAADPATDRELSGLRFTVPTWANGEGVSRNGWEFSAKTAFPYLPALLRHTGIDFNYTRIRPAGASGRYRDLNSGDLLPPVGEPKHTGNVSLWYDDGAWRARVALQMVATRFSCIAPCGGNSGASNYPADGATHVVLPYVPGVPLFVQETRYLDARIAYRFPQGVEIFAEGRNLGRTTVQTDTGPYARHASGAPMLVALGYGGARYSVGAVIRY